MKAVSPNKSQRVLESMLPAPTTKVSLFHQEKIRDQGQIWTNWVYDNLESLCPPKPGLAKEIALDNKHIVSMRRP